MDILNGLSFHTLDISTDAEIEDVLKEIGPGCRPVSAARRIFPDRPTGYVNRAKDLRNYGWNLITARRHPDQAHIYRGICDRIRGRSRS